MKIGFFPPPKYHISQHVIISLTYLNNLINTLKNKDEKLVDDCITSFKQSVFSLVDTLIKDEYNINIDEEFAKNICNQLNIDCTDKEISDFVKEVTNMIDHGSIELSTVLKTGIDKMLDAFISAPSKRLV